MSELPVHHNPHEKSDNTGGDTEDDPALQKQQPSVPQGGEEEDLVNVDQPDLQETEAEGGMCRNLELIVSSNVTYGCKCYRFACH